MASRPYLSRKGHELVAIFRSGREDKKILKILRAELIHRTTPSMHKLRSLVDEALAHLEAAPTMPPATRPAAGSRCQPELPLAPHETAPPDGHDTPSPMSKRAAADLEPPRPADSNGT